VFEGVYAVEKDTLKVCVNKETGSVKNRPGGLSTEGQASWRLMVFERVKPEDAGGPEAGFVGIQLRMDADRGVVVDAALDKSPAQAAGLKKDDVVLRIGGRDVADLQATVEACRAAKPGGKLEVRVRRDGKEMDVTVRAGLLPFEILAELG
jgi:S1-C subfamily serine protease